MKYSFSVLHETECNTIKSIYCKQIANLVLHPLSCPVYGLLISRETPYSSILIQTTYMMMQGSKIDLQKTEP